MPNVTYESDCPFYGYHAILGLRVLAATGGNQCALVTSCYAPCRMLTRGDNPSWKDCPLQKQFTPEFAAELMSYEKHDLRYSPTLKGGPQ